MFSMELVLWGIFATFRNEQIELKGDTLENHRKSFLIAMITMETKLRGPVGPVWGTQGLCLRRRPVGAFSLASIVSACLVLDMLTLTPLVSPCSTLQFVKLWVSVLLRPPPLPCLGYWCTGEDLERNDGSAEKPYFVTPSLHRVLTKTRPVSQRQRE